MGVVTYLDHTLGLKLSPRLKTILTNVDEGYPVDAKDLKFLIDNTARFETIEARLQEKTYPLKDDMMDDEYEIKDILSDMVIELRYLYASRIQEGKYFLPCVQFDGYAGKAIERLNVRDLEDGVLEAVKGVKFTQKHFDENGDALTVIGYFPTLQKKYGFEYTFTAEASIAAVNKALVTHMKEYAINLQAQLNDTISKWDKMKP